MKSAVVTWLVFRALRWLCWIAFLTYTLWVWANPAPFHDSYGHLLNSTEAWIFGLGCGSVFLCFFEMMFRERAGLRRPEFGEFIPPADQSASGRVR
jgi:hypothetical protein